MFIGLTDLDAFIGALAQAGSQDPNEVPYCKLESKMFEGKVFEFQLRENNLGRYLVISETVLKKVKSVYVADRDFDSITTFIKAVVSKAEATSSVSNSKPGPLV